ncbi:MAG TPA: PAS domain-containing sensor histidine kinase [Gammaproteobacteria bacterium]|nr:nitrogen regulation protein NR(II) [Pseudomonadota bacterium]HBF09644.1 PAS domain-containing sensor histidine kinase [Gammaproteobacteria bacterium]HCK94031.1 PAS domain-containing sensor histidine kinase [Gammaproteobacteria bacterium]|tara:strand:+ start:519 stop:1682 length:1164 start_codon:yes stop_codon:yes gene_type:complete
MTDIKQKDNSKMNFSQVLGQLSTAICVLRPDLTVIYINSAAENTLQISAQRALNTALPQIVHLPDGLKERIESCTHNLQPFAQRESCWIINDQEITLDIVVTPVVQEQKVEKIIIEFQVVDRILKISRDDKTHHSHQAHRALIRGLAHEVKNPLGAIRGATQLLERCLTQEYHEYTEVIIQEVDRLSKLVDSMLGPRTPLSVNECNIHEIIEHVLRLVAVEARSKGEGNQIAIERQYDLSLPELHGDRDRLVQAILNVITNARQALLSYRDEIIKAVEEHGENDIDYSPTITITTKIARQMTLHQRLHRLVLHVCIADNGPGIPDNLMLSLFYPLVSGRAEGSGIGLSIAQHVVQQHGGIIECESKPGHTQFHLYIPAHFLPLGESS